MSEPRDERVAPEPSKAVQQVIGAPLSAYAIGLNAITTQIALAGFCFILGTYFGYANSGAAASRTMGMMLMIPTAFAIYFGYRAFTLSRQFLYLGERGLALVGGKPATLLWTQVRNVSQEKAVLKVNGVGRNGEPVSIKISTRFDKWDEAVSLVNGRVESASVAAEDDDEDTEAD